MIKLIKAFLKSIFGAEDTTQSTLADQVRLDACNAKPAARNSLSALNSKLNGGKK